MVQDNKSRNTRLSFCTRKILRLLLICFVVAIDIHRSVSAIFLFVFEVYKLLFHNEMVISYVEEFATQI